MAMVLSPDAFVIKINQVINGSLDLEVVYQAVVDEVGQYLHADQCFISRFDPSTGELCAPKREFRSSSQVKSIVDEAPVTLWGSLSEYAKGVCRETEPIDYQDMHHILSADAKAALTILQVHSGIAVAVRFHQCLGILFVHSVEEQRIWGNEEKQALKLIAYQVAAVTHHANLYQQVEELAVRRQILNQLYQRAIMDIEPNDLFELVLDQIGERLGINVSKIIQFLPKERPAEPLRLVACRGLSTHLIGKSFDAGFEPHAAYTLEAKRPIVVTNIHQEKRFSPSPLHLEYGLISGVAVVIWGTQQPYGVLEIDAHQERFFSIEDIQFLEAIANLLGTVLERKQVEKLAYRSEQQFKLMVQGLKDHAVAWLNPEGIIESWNLAAEIIFGYSAEEILGQPCQLLYTDEEIANQLPQQLLRAAAQQGQTTQEGPKCCRDGKLIYCEVTITALYDQEHQLLGYVAIARDISARRKAEAQVLATYRALTEVTNALNVSTIVAITDPQGLITEVNEAFCRISKYSREELLGQDHRILNSGYHSKAFFQNLWATIAQGQVWKGEIRNRAKDGSIYWVDTTIVPYLNEQGRPKQYVAIRHDITLQKNAETHLLESNRDLEQFAAIASHDLQAPLRKVKMFSHILVEQAQSKMNQEELELFRRINLSIDTMQQLIRDLLELSRISSEHQHFEKVDLNQVISKVIVNLEEKIQETQAELDLGHLEAVYGDSNQLTQLLQNLIENALKYQVPGNRPKLSIQSDCEAGKSCSIRVRDNGIGINPDHIDRIFKPFERLHGKSSIYRGTGIGLAICKRIVERHQGQIKVESRLGEGTTFTVELPKISSEHSTLIPLSTCE